MFKKVQELSNSNLTRMSKKKIELLLILSVTLIIIITRVIIIHKRDKKTNLLDYVILIDLIRLILLEISVIHVYEKK